eukprot:gene7543-692_t
MQLSPSQLSPMRPPINITHRLASHALGRVAPSSARALPPLLSHRTPNALSPSHAGLQPCLVGPWRGLGSMRAPPTPRGALGAMPKRGAESGEVDSPPSQIVKHMGLDLNLPTTCCGCGVHMQRTSPESPGSTRRYEFVDDDEDEDLDEDDEARRELDAELEARLSQSWMAAGVMAAGAAGAGHFEIVEMLLGAPHNPAKADCLNSMALLKAADGGFEHIVCLLLSTVRGLPQAHWVSSFTASHSLPGSAAGSGSLSGSPESRSPPSRLLRSSLNASQAPSPKVKSELAEEMLPEFDLGKKVGKKIFLQKDRRAVVLCVVDVWDFDGSLPRGALKALYPPGLSMDEPLPPDLIKFKLMVAVNKSDLLPKEATALRVTAWVRTRLRQAGLPPPEKVFLVSAVKGSGVREMVDNVKTALGFRGDLWVVGAQNAGKSEPTIAPMPGTTLGLINVPGVPLGPKNRTFDTPGVAHDYQITTLLGYEDVKRVLPSTQLRGRTFRVGAGNSLLIGALARIDITDIPGSSIYLTVFVSHGVDLHMGKTENVDARLATHAGTLLSPPASLEEFERLPDWNPTDISLEGDAWDKSSVDVAIAGLGWIGIGSVGRVDLRVWTYPGISVTSHAALIPDYARFFEKPGFSSLMPKVNMAGGPKKGVPNKSRGGKKGKR